MKKSVLSDGTNIYIINVDMYITIDIFTKHLTEYYFNNGNDFNKKLTKKGAIEILNVGLLNYGINGRFETEYMTIHFSEENNNRYNEIYNNAYNWVSKKCPYLIKK